MNFSELFYWFYFPKGCNISNKCDGQLNEVNKLIQALVPFRSLDKTNNEYFKAWFLKLPPNTAVYLTVYSEHQQIINLLKYFSREHAWNVYQIEKLQKYVDLKQCKAPMRKKVRCKALTTSKDGVCPDHKHFSKLVLAAPSFLIRKCQNKENANEKYQNCALAGDI